jgi:hypothetical protein
MRTAREPVLFLSVYLHRQRPETKDDARIPILRQMDEFVGLYKLRVPEDSTALNTKASHIDLRAIDWAQGAYLLLFEARAGFSEEHATAGYEAVIYSYHDSIVLQLQITRFQDWQGSLEEGWQQLTSEIRAGFGESIEAAAQSSVFGVSVVYWIISDNNVRPEGYEPDIRGLKGASAGRTETDIGPLWSWEFPFFSGARIHQDVWVLATSREFEPEVNSRYYQLAPDGPPAFGEVALARHKIFFELAQHGSVRRNLERRARVLEQQTFSFLTRQRRLGSKLDELASDTAIDFEGRLSRATNHLAAYRNRLGQLKELRRTIEVNRRNYLLHCLRLVSAKKLKTVENSRDRERAATEALDSLDNDGVFACDLGIIAQQCQQVDTDIGYSESVADRHTLALRSATDQLRIAGEREIAEMARHMAVDSAAVVASVAALVIIELAERRHFDTARAVLGDARFLRSFHSLEGWFLVAGVILLVYGLTQAFGARFRGAKPGLKSIVGGAALVFAWIGIANVYHPRGLRDFTVYQTCEPTLLEHWQMIFLPALLGALVGYIAYLGAWRYMQGQRRKKLLLRRSRL